ncbi:MAG: glycosyltransferase family 4 protein [Aquabacterium sp.]|nr:glycosyltransferase family 4 protein [Aquabacterium sp.]
MRVLHLLSSTGFHGAESMTAELVRQLSILGVEIHVAAFDSGNGGNTEVLQAVEGHARGVVRIPCQGPLDRRALALMNRYIDEQHIDLVHSHKYKTTFYAMPGRWAGRYRLVTTYHNWLMHTRALRLYAFLDKRLARFNDAAIAVSTPVSTELRRFVTTSKVHQIDNGIDTQHFARQWSKAEAREALGLSPTQAVIGFVGRLSDEKGLPYLIEALRDPALAHTHTLLTGEGDARPALEALIQQAGLQDRVQLLGNRRDTPLIYAAMDVFVLPSVLEAFPMVLLEAMACGCPVIATDVGEVGRIIEPERTGLIVPAGNPPALIQALSRVLSDAEWGKRMGFAGAERVCSTYSSRAMAERYLEVYQHSLR